MKYISHPTASPCTPLARVNVEPPREVSLKFFGVNNSQVLIDSFRCISVNSIVCGFSRMSEANTPKSNSILFPMSSTNPSLRDSALAPFFCSANPSRCYPTPSLVLVPSAKPIKLYRTTASCCLIKSSEPRYSPFSRKKLPD